LVCLLLYGVCRLEVFCPWQFIVVSESSEQLLCRKWYVELVYHLDYTLRRLFLSSETIQWNLYSCCT
jgi:hypothetical protein